MTVNGLTVLIAAAIFLAWFLGARAALRRWDGSHDPETPRRPYTRRRAWGTRARRSAMRSAGRRAGTTWQATRERLALRIHGITITRGGDPGGPAYDPVTLLRTHPAGPDPTGELVDWEPAEPTRKATDDTDLPDGGGPQFPAPVRQPETADPDHPAPEGGFKADVLPDGGDPVPSCAPARQPTRKATGAERRWHLTEPDAAPLDYAPGPPFASVLSPDTLARGMPAVKP